MHAVAESGPRQGTTTALCFVFVSGGENTKTTPHRQGPRTGEFVSHRFFPTPGFV
jgi:hypothetical protein